MRALIASTMREASRDHGHHRLVDEREILVQPLLAREGAALETARQGHVLCLVGRARRQMSLRDRQQQVTLLDTGAVPKRSRSGAANVAGLERTDGRDALMIRCFPSPASLERPRYSGWMVGVQRLRLGQPAALGPVLELGVSNAFGRWMRRSGWLGFTLPLPFVVIVFYWLRARDEAPDPFVRVHEFVHVRQARRLLLFSPRYLAALVTDGGYRRNRFEADAYRVEAEARASGLPDWARGEEGQ